MLENLTWESNFYQTAYPKLCRKMLLVFYILQHFSLQLSRQRRFECRDMIHCTVATLMSLNRDVSLPTQTEILRGKGTVYVAHALQDCSFIIPTCTSMGMNSKAGVYRHLLQEELVSHGGLVYTEWWNSPLPMQMCGKRSHWTCCGFSCVQR